MIKDYTDELIEEYTLLTEADARYLLAPEPDIHFFTFGTLNKKDGLVSPPEGEKFNTKGNNAKAVALAALKQDLSNKHEQIIYVNKDFQLAYSTDIKAAIANKAKTDLDKSWAKLLEAYTCKDLYPTLIKTADNNFYAVTSVSSVVKGSSKYSVLAVYFKLVVNQEKLDTSNKQTSIKNFRGFETVDGSLKLITDTAQPTLLEYIDFSENKGPWYVESLTEEDTELVAQNKKAWDTTNPDGLTEVKKALEKINMAEHTKLSKSLLSVVCPYCKGPNPSSPFNIYYKARGDGEEAWNTGFGIPLVLAAVCPRCTGPLANTKEYRALPDRNSKVEWMKQQLEYKIKHGNNGGAVTAEGDSGSDVPQKEPTKIIDATEMWAKTLYPEKWKLLSEKNFEIKNGRKIINASVIVKLNKNNKQVSIKDEKKIKTSAYYDLNKISKDSKLKLWWDCDNGIHAPSSSIARNVFRREYACKKCTELTNNSVSFGELFILFVLESLNKANNGIFTNIRHTYVLPNSETKRNLDIYFEYGGQKFGIEYDGSSWHKDVENDIAKDKLCKKEKITLLRIRENGCPEYPDTSKAIKIEKLTGVIDYATVMSNTTITANFIKEITGYILNLIGKKDDNDINMPINPVQASKGGSLRMDALSFISLERAIPTVTVLQTDESWKVLNISGSNFNTTHEGRFFTYGQIAAGIKGKKDVKKSIEINNNNYSIEDINADLIKNLVIANRKNPKQTGDRPTIDPIQIKITKSTGVSYFVVRDFYILNKTTADSAKAEQTSESLDYLNEGYNYTDTLIFDILSLNRKK